MNTSASSIRWIRQLIWAYFFLIIFEGALRKWVVPGLSNVLLLVRDPIVIAIYLLAIRARLFPWNTWVMLLSLLGPVCLFAGMYVLQDTPLVPLFGFRTDFMHFPLVFIIPRVFDFRDVKKMGFWALAICIPMAMLMVLQFKSPPGAWINTTAGGTGRQIAAAAGHIRAPGTFTFISGPAAYFPLVASFLLASVLSKIQYPRWLLISATLAFFIGAVVSASRTLVASAGVVVIFAAFAGTVLQPYLVSRSMILRSVQTVFVLAIVIFAALQFSVFNEGIQVFSTRVANASIAEGGTKGFVSRSTNSFTDALSLFADTPLTGYGLGLGTNAGAALVNNGKVTYLLAEGEWDRVILESGPVLGTAFLLMRVALVVWLFALAARQARAGNALPFLLLGSCSPLLLIGQLGQPTDLGFAVLGGGLTFASMRTVPVAQAVAPAPRMERRTPHVAA